MKCTKEDGGCYCDDCFIEESTDKFGPVMWLLFWLLFTLGFIYQCVYFAINVTVLYIGRIAKKVRNNGDK